MKTVAVLLAAGNGTRFGADKTQIDLAGRPVWRWSYDVFATHPNIEEIVVVAGSGNLPILRAELGPSAVIVPGGATRQASARIGVEKAREFGDAVLIHDAARPFVSHAVLDRVMAEVAEGRAAAPGVPVADTVKRVRSGAVTETLDRSELVAVQTPQGARIADLLQAYATIGGKETTDDLSVLEAAGSPTTIVEGETRNFKVTLPEDLLRAQAIAGRTESRTGIGYDVHRFSEDASRHLWLGGVLFEGEIGLEGHSDADVVMHAATDALLGAAALGDIGVHFPNTDERWRNLRSEHFLKHAVALVREHGWRLANLDIAILAETPRIMRQALAMREAIARAMAVEIERIGLKATTNEGLGAIGRSEGIAAFATATIVRP